MGLSPEKIKTLTSFQKTNLQTNLHRKFRKKIYFRVAFSQGQGREMDGGIHVLKIVERK